MEAILWLLLNWLYDILISIKQTQNHRKKEPSYEEGLLILRLAALYEEPFFFL